MTDAQLFSEILALPSNLKMEVFDLVTQLKKRAKNKNIVFENKVEEATPKYGKKFSDILLNGPVFSDAQIQKIKKTRKSLNEWRTK